MDVINWGTQVVQRFLGTSNQARLKRFASLLQTVSQLETEMQNREDTELRALSLTLRQRVQEGGESLDAVRAEAFALVREVADRRLGMWTALRAAHPQWNDEDWGEHRSEVDALRQRLEQGEAAWDIDVSAGCYACVRDHFPVSAPPFRMRAHDVQVLGAMVLHAGHIAEMKTGEGKTLVASFAAYLNALSGRSVHIVTVNDYLARRDAEWNRPTLQFLSVTISYLQGDMDPSTRLDVYAKDVIYGTNNEFGFDYLRDNLKQDRKEQVQRDHAYAIVDEVDSVLIDEARTPLIISGPANSKPEQFVQADAVAKQLQEGEHFEVDIKDRHVTLTEEGIEKAAELFGVDNLYDSEAMHLPHYLDNALKARYLFHRDKEYLVRGEEVCIIDEFTGRPMQGRRWSDGLHQAVEAKEGVQIKEETQTYATITLQNYFRMYDKLAGMTGTAMTEAQEFNDIYGLLSVAVPTNRPIARVDHPDLIYGSEDEKFDAIVQEVAELNAVGQPVLVGTISVEVSERLSELFKRRGIKHNVLNARQNAREAEIVADAGKLGAVTVATNMAGRGTDIVLGKASGKELLKHWASVGMAPKRKKIDDADIEEAILDLWCKRYLDDKERERCGTGREERLSAINTARKRMGYYALAFPSDSLREGVDVRQLGGLRIVGTERHESRRIDNQLRGRSGRQGDPGSSRFFLSLSDDLMRRFAGPTMANLMRGLGLKNGVPIESKMVSRQIEKAQKRVEEMHYGMRKNLLEYDGVMNVQRKQIYALRQRILEGEAYDDLLFEYFTQATDDIVQEAAADGTRGEELDVRIRKAFDETFHLSLPEGSRIPVDRGGDACVETLMGVVREAHDRRRESLGQIFPTVQRFVLLNTIDTCWKDHLYAMDHLRHSIGLVSYGQKDPKLIFKEQGFRFFVQMFERLRKQIAGLFFRVEVAHQAPPDPLANDQKPAPAADELLRSQGFMPRGQLEDAQRTIAPKGPLDQPKPDDPCPCGSGSPYRHCHGTV